VSARLAEAPAGELRTPARTAPGHPAARRYPPSRDAERTLGAETARRQAPGWPIWRVNLAFSAVLRIESEHEFCYGQNRETTREIGNFEEE